LADLRAIRAYIEQFSPLAAQRIALRLGAAGESLRDQSERGREVRGGLRELVIIQPYILRYQVSGDVISIVRIRHAARRPD
jgi:toxin ParE1/3/4